MTMLKERLVCAVDCLLIRGAGVIDHIGRATIRAGEKRARKASHRHARNNGVAGARVFWVQSAREIDDDEFLIAPAGNESQIAPGINGSDGRRTCRSRQGSERADEYKGKPCYFVFLHGDFLYRGAIRSAAG
jgi:hypothetical protein